MATQQQAVVKSVLSADTLVLRGKLLPGGTIPKERTLRFQGIEAPRAGNRERSDEPFAFEAREYLRVLLVGKEIRFTVTHSTSPSSILSTPLDFGSAFILLPSGQEIDITLQVVKAGWARVRDDKGKENEDVERKLVLREAEDEAKIMAKGVWSVEGPVKREVEYQMPEDPSAFLQVYKGKPLDAIIESVPNGSTLRARLLLSPTSHQMISLSLAGVRAPRASSLQNDSQGEEHGDSARYFVESRLLQRQIKITLLSLPNPSVVPTSFNPSAASGPTATEIAPPSFFLGTIAHPAGNIAALLLATGFAKCVDWHAGFLSVSPTPTMMSELRTAELKAKTARIGLWSSLPAPAPGAAEVQRKLEKERKWEGKVVRVWGADMLSIVRDGDGKEFRIQLSSVRQPRVSDPKLAGLQAEGKELLRKKLIGKSVSVNIDYIKAAEGDYEARECATIRNPSGSNVAEILVERGLVSVVRHRQGDEQRSSDYDKLLAAEAKALAAAKGIHSGKEFPLARIIDASETAQKAAPFLSSFKRSGRTAAIVDFVAAASRFKVFIPKQDLKLTLVLSGIRAPRTARNAGEKSEAFGNEAATFISRKCLQQDVEILVETVDKSGGFIGKMFLGSENVAVLLVREGLAKVDEYAAGSRELTEAQDEAKSLKKNLWRTYDAEADAAASGKAAEPAAARREYVDVVVSDVRGGGETPFSFAVQILTQNGGIPALENLMGELSLHHAESSSPVNFVPRMNDIVSAQFSDDNAWYRARVRRCNPAKKEADVLYIDYGNSETVPFSRLQPLSPQLKALEPQSKEATLSFVTLLDSSTEYGPDALNLFKDLCEGQQLVANIDARENNLLHLSLFDPKNPSASMSHESSINVLLVREGLARIDMRSRFRGAYPAVVKALDEAVKEAKRSRNGAYELGDIFED